MYAGTVANRSESTSRRENLLPSFILALYRSPIVRFTGGHGTKWPACKVPVNELQNLPHQEGQLVLHAVAPGREIKFSVHHGRYWVDCAITCGTVTWTRLMAGRDTIEEARGTALWILREPV